MFGNISFHIVKIPNSFYNSQQIAPEKRHTINNLSPSFFDSLSFTKDITHRKIKRYFRYKDYINKVNSMKDLNFNNNRRNFLSIKNNTKIMRSFRNFIEEPFERITPLTTKAGKYHKIFFENTKGIKMRNLKNPLNYSECIKKIKNFDNETSKYNEIMSEEKNIENYDKKVKNLIFNFKTYLKNNKPKNIKELNRYLNHNFFLYMKHNDRPWKPLTKSNSVEDIFNMTIDKKIEELTILTPKAKHDIKNLNRKISFKNQLELFENKREKCLYPLVKNIKIINNINVFN